MPLLQPHLSSPLLISRTFIKAIFFYCCPAPDAIRNTFP